MEIAPKRVNKQNSGFIMKVIVFPLNLKNMDWIYFAECISRECVEMLTIDKKKLLSI